MGVYSCQDIRGRKHKADFKSDLYQFWYSRHVSNTGGECMHIQECVSARYFDEVCMCVWAHVNVISYCQCRFTESSDVICGKPFLCAVQKWNVFDVAHGLCPMPRWEYSSVARGWIPFHVWPCGEFLKGIAVVWFSEIVNIFRSPQGVFQPQVFSHFLFTMKTGQINSWRAHVYVGQNFNETENVLHIQKHTFWHFFPTFRINFKTQQTCSGVSSVSQMLCFIKCVLRAKHRTSWNDLYNWHHVVW